MKLPKDKKVYVIGMDGLEEELKEEGINYIGGTVRTSLVAVVSQAHLQTPVRNVLGPRRQHV